MANMIQGGCYCGAVRYESSGKVLRFIHCHCPDCRKLSGATFASIIAVEAGGFRVISGQDHLQTFPSSPGKQRCFCKTCGSHVIARFEARPEMILIRAGSVDGDPGVRPDAHIWVGCKAPWHDILDGIPQHSEGLSAR
jgi:hypothetical protein